MLSYPRSPVPPVLRQASYPIRACAVPANQRSRQRLRIRTRPLRHGIKGVVPLAKVARELDFNRATSSKRPSAISPKWRTNGPIPLREDPSEGSSSANQHWVPKRSSIHQPVVKESSWRQFRDPNPLPPWARPSPDTPGTARKKKESHGKEI